MTYQTPLNTTISMGIGDKIRILKKYGLYLANEIQARSQNLACGTTKFG